MHVARQNPKGSDLLVLGVKHRSLVSYDLVGTLGNEYMVLLASGPNILFKAIVQERKNNSHACKSSQRQQGTYLIMVGSNTDQKIRVAIDFGEFPLASASEQSRFLPLPRRIASNLFRMVGTTHSAIAWTYTGDVCS